MTLLLKDIAAHLDALNEEKGWVPSLRFGAAGALASFGEHATAVLLYQRLVVDNPKHAWAWIGLVESLRACADHEAAVAAGHEGLSHLPNNALLWRKTATAMCDRDGAASAAAFFLGAQHIGLSQDDLLFGISLFRQSGQPDQAAPLCRLLLDQNPDSYLAHMALIEGALSTGKTETTRDAAMAAFSRAPDHPELLLRIAQGLFHAGEPSIALRALDGIPAIAFDETCRALRERCLEANGEVEISKLLSAHVDHGLVDDEEPAKPAQDEISEGPALDPSNEGAQVSAPEGDSTASEQGSSLWHDLEELEAALSSRPYDAARPLEALLRSPSLPWYIALHWVARVHEAVSPEAAELVASFFGGAAWGKQDRQAFEIEDRLLRCGPRAALDWIRSNPLPSRNREAAERLGRVLIGAGTGPVAARYLRACCHKWPEDRDLCEMAKLANAMCGTCDTEELASAADGPSVISLQEDGARSPLVEEVERRLLSGDLAGAEDGLKQIATTDGRLEEALICRPRATRVGSLLNEARILAAAGINWVDDGADALAPFIDGFFLPARSIVAQSNCRQIDGGPGGAIPQTVHLVWPKKTHVTAEAERLFDAWRMATRRKITIHAISDAAKTLEKLKNADLVKAFRATKDPEQKADLLMLAIAVERGGAVFRANQWPSAGIDDLLDAADKGAVLFRDSDGSITLDAILTEAGHPLPARALDTIVLSNQNRENDHRWFKTGPGLMTRVLAGWLIEPKPQQCAVQVKPIKDLRQRAYRYTYAKEWTPGAGKGMRGDALATALAELCSPQSSEKQLLS